VVHEDFQAEIKNLYSEFGEPRKVDFDTIEMQPQEFALVQRSRQKGRRHDVTVFIRYEGKYAVIAKHAYANTGIMRAPSGGALPSETLVEAAIREAREETGLEIKLERFILESYVRLRHENITVDWVSYVFLAKAIGGQLGAEDVKEISDVQLKTREELLEDIRPLMLASGLGGFKYRALLTDAFFNQLDLLKLS
jgi:8-oxo-dGTP diphosphatase